MARPRNPLKRVRDICLALPEASEKEAWGRPTFRIRGKKMFAMAIGSRKAEMAYARV